MDGVRQGAGGCAAVRQGERLMSGLCALRQPAGIWLRRSLQLSPRPAPPFSLSRQRKGGKRKALNAGLAPRAKAEAVHRSQSDEPASALPRPSGDPPAGNTGRTWQREPARPSGERRSPNERAGWRFVRRSSAPPVISAESDPYPGRRLAPLAVALRCMGWWQSERCTAFPVGLRPPEALSAFLCLLSLAQQRKEVPSRGDIPAGCIEQQQHRRTA